MSEAPRSVQAWVGAVGAFATYLAGQFAGGLAAMPAIFVVVSRDGIDVLARADQLFTSPGVYVPMLAETGLVQTALPILIALVARGEAIRTLGLHRAPIVPLLLAPVGMLALQPVSDLCVTTFAHFFPHLTFGALDQLAALGRSGPFALMFLLMAVGPGVSEELIFRGLLQRSIERRWLAILVSALAFSFAHVDPQHVVGVLPVAFYLAWVSARSDSTWVTIAAHITNNGMAVLAMRVDSLNVGFGTDKAMPLWAIVGGIVVGTMCIVGIALATRPRKL